MKDRTATDVPIDFEQWELQARSWADYEAMEHADLGELYREFLWRRNYVNEGAYEYKEIRLRILYPDEERKARALAVAIAAEDGIDRDKDADVFQNLDAVCILWYCVREPTPPFEPLGRDPKDLERRLGKARIEQAWNKLEALKRVVNPIPAEMTPDKMLALSAAIVRERAIRPLLVYDIDSQASYVVSMAELHVISAVAKSSSEPSEPSTPEP